MSYSVVSQDSTTTPLVFGYSAASGLLLGCTAIPRLLSAMFLRAGDQPGHGILMFSQAVNSWTCQDEQTLIAFGSALCGWIPWTTSDFAHLAGDGSAELSVSLNSAIPVGFSSDPWDCSDQLYAMTWPPPSRQLSTNYGGVFQLINMIRVALSV